MTVGSNAVISGKEVANAVIEKVKLSAEQLGKDGIRPGLAVVIVGCDPASQVYVGSKGRMAEECGFLSAKHELGEEASEQELLVLIDSLNRDTSIHGILVQLPLPSHIDPARVIQSISPAKDVDGFHFLNVGKLGAGVLDTAFVPCTPAGSMILVERAIGKDLSGLNAVVVGRSNIVGKPMANLLLAANATVTIAHSRTRDLPWVCRQADILVAAVGRPEMIKGDWIRPGAVVIDVGINRVAHPTIPCKSKIVGDVDFEGARRVAGTVTPVPGGVGPMTIAMLMANTVRAAALIHGKPSPVF